MDLTEYQSRIEEINRNAEEEKLNLAIIYAEEHALDIAIGDVIEIGSGRKMVVEKFRIDRWQLEPRRIYEGRLLTKKGTVRKRDSQYTAWPREIVSIEKQTSQGGEE